jgi:glycosyltransferase involved in cell wall biosynthesis
MTLVGNIRVVAILQGNSITGSAKSVLEFALEAESGRVSSPKVELSIIILSRSPKQNMLTSEIRRANIGLNVVFERRQFDPGVIPQLQALIEARRPDVIWSNSVKSHFFVRLGRLNRTARWVASHHGYITTDIKLRFYNELDRWSLRAANRILTVCNPFAKVLESKGIRPSHIRVQHMPVRPFQTVDPARIDKLRRQLGITDGTRVLLSVGRLSKEKGHADLIYAFKAFRQRIPNAQARLILVGEGPERPHLLSLCRRFELGEEVSLVGHQDDVGSYYSIADLFVLPSHNEGSPNVLLEAMAAGIPVIATNAGGIPEIATHETDALLVKKQDVDALSAAIFRMLEDAELRQRLSCSSKRVVLRHSPEAYYRSITSVFAEALSA